MWWQQEWHVWAGLGVGIAGLGVGIGAWVYAARASSRATEAKDAIAIFEKKLGDRLAEERVRRSTKPVTHEPANFTYRREDGEWWLTNQGPGVAYQVKAQETGGTWELISRKRWSEFRVDQREKLELRSEDHPFDYDAVLELEWIEFAEGPVETDELIIPIGSSQS